MTSSRAVGGTQVNELAPYVQHCTGLDNIAALVVRSLSVSVDKMKELVGLEISVQSNRFELGGRHRHFPTASILLMPFAVREIKR